MEFEFDAAIELSKILDYFRYEGFTVHYERAFNCLTIENSIGVEVTLKSLKELVGFYEASIAEDTSGFFTKHKMETNK